MVPSRSQQVKFEVIMMGLKIDFLAYHAGRENHLDLTREEWCLYPVVSGCLVLCPILSGLG